MEPPVETWSCKEWRTQSLEALPFLHTLPHVSFHLAVPKS